MVREVTLVRDDVGRQWKGTVMADAPGHWTVSARLPRPGMDPLFAHALVVAKPDAWEQQSTAANGALMRELASSGLGRDLGGENPASVLAEVDRLGSRLIEYRRRSLWDRAWVWGCLLGFLSVEWVLRRRWSSL